MTFRQLLHFFDSVPGSLSYTQGGSNCLVNNLPFGIWRRFNVFDIRFLSFHVLVSFLLLRSHGSYSELSELLQLLSCTVQLSPAPLDVLLSQFNG